MMELRITCSLRFIEADKSILDLKFENYKIVMGGDLLDANIFTQNVIEQGGQIVLREFINYPFFYMQTDGNPDELPRITDSSLSALNRFINFLWISKDNSVNVGNLFCFSPDAKYLMRTMKLAWYSNSKGGSEEVLITKADWEFALRAFEQFENLSSSNDDITLPKTEFPTRPVITDSSYHYTDYNKNTRIERALSFLTMARTSSFLPLKISLSMSLLECLFTTDKQEVTHKVCERVALYLGGTYEQKMQTYSAIKEAYAVRSGFFHGQEIDKKQDSRAKLVLHSIKVDDMLREILKKVLFEDSSIFNGTTEARIEFFNKMIFK